MSNEKIFKKCFVLKDILLSHKIQIMLFTHVFKKSIKMCNFNPNLKTKLNLNIIIIYQNKKIEKLS